MKITVESQVFLQIYKKSTHNKTTKTYEANKNTAESPYLNPGPSCSTLPRHTLLSLCPTLSPTPTAICPRHPHPSPSPTIPSSLLPLLTPTNLSGFYCRWCKLQVVLIVFGVIKIITDTFHMHKISPYVLITLKYFTNIEHKYNKSTRKAHTSAKAAQSGSGSGF